MLSKKTKYGIKALIYLAKQESRNPVAIAVISKSENISLKFLESILLTIRKNGFLGSKKGKGGRLLSSSGCERNKNDFDHENFRRTHFNGSVCESQFLRKM